jgi:hypothetical protein
MGTVSADKQKKRSGLEFVQGLVDGSLPLLKREWSRLKDELQGNQIRSQDKAARC